MRCERCNKEVVITTCSMFNTDTICMECKDKERSHPLYKIAQEAENMEVLKGNYIFEGIGLPDDLN